MPNYNHFTPNSKLAFAGIIRLLLGFIILGLFLFACAGDFYFWNMWLYLSTLFLVILLFGIYLYRNDQTLLNKRLNGKEKEVQQNAYVVITSLSLLATFTICGLDYRFASKTIEIQHEQKVIDTG